MYVGSCHSFFSYCIKFTLLQGKVLPPHAQDAIDEEFNKFMNECKTRVNSSNENELNSILKSLIVEHKIQSKYPLLIWLIYNNSVKKLKSLTNGRYQDQSSRAGS